MNDPHVSWGCVLMMMMMATMMMFGMSGMAITGSQSIGQSDYPKAAQHCVREAVWFRVAVPATLAKQILPNHVIGYNLPFRHSLRHSIALHTSVQTSTYINTLMDAWQLYR